MKPPIGPVPFCGGCGLRLNKCRGGPYGDGRCMGTGFASPMHARMIRAWRALMRWGRDWFAVLIVVEVLLVGVLVGLVAYSVLTGRVPL